MSANVISKSHIDAIINAGLSGMPREHGPLSWYASDPRSLMIQESQKAYRQLTDETANQVGQMLIDECVKSVSYRYQDSDITDLPGPVNGYWLIPYELGYSDRIPTPVETLKLIRCYEYQSCEHPEWPESEAYRFCQALTAAMMTYLPGYEEAPWDWEEQTKAVKQS